MAITIGTHHIGLTVPDLTATRNGPAQHMMCYIPGGIRMEFIVWEGVA